MMKVKVLECYLECTIVYEVECVSSLLLLSCFKIASSRSQSGEFLFCEDVYEIEN